MTELKALRVWWIPQAGVKTNRVCDIMFVPVDSIAEGSKLCSVLADFENILSGNKIRPYRDQIQYLKDGEWVEFDLECFYDKELVALGIKLS